MKVKFTKDFLLQYKKTNVRIRNRTDERLRIFKRNPNDPQLKNHKLKREWIGHRSISITSDWRALYVEKREGEDIIAYFVTFGTHRELYK